MKHRSRTGFTLIEMLVVIAIIALLAAIAFGGVTRALRAARQNSAASEATSVAMAISFFYKDYGWLPLAANQQGGTGDGVMVTGTDSADIIKVLMAEEEDPPPGEKKINYKENVYLDLDIPDSSGELLDPWGNQYQMMLDLNFDGKIEYDEKIYNTKAIVVSSGRDETIGNDDDVASVELSE